MAINRISVVVSACWTFIFLAGMSGRMTGPVGVLGFQPMILLTGYQHSRSVSAIRKPDVACKNGALCMSSDKEEEESSGSTPSSADGHSKLDVKLLGRGKEAIVRPGVVLVAPPDEFHHFLRNSAVFIYAMGEDEDDNYVIRGVIIDHPTPFTMHEMMPEGQAALDGQPEAEGQPPVPDFLQNLLYRGGELGNAVFMLHSDQRLSEEADQEAIGSSGIYQGGLEHAQANNYDINPDRCKFFFSFMEFTEAELDEMLENREDESTQWVSVEVPPDFVLNSQWERGEAWARLRNAVRER